MFFQAEAVLCACLAVPAVGLAAQSLTFHVDSLEGESIRAEGIELRLDPLPDFTFSLDARIESIELPGTGDRFQSVELRCPTANVDAVNLHCPKGTLRLRHPLPAYRDMPISLNWNFDEQRLDLSLSDVGLAGGTWSVRLTFDANQTRVDLRGSQFKTDDLLAILQQRQAFKTDWMVSGAADLNLTASLAGTGLEQAYWTLKLRQAAFNNAPESWLGEGLEALLSGSLRAAKGGSIRGEVALELTAGALLSPFFYLEAGEQSVRLSSRINLDDKGERLGISGLSYRHPNVLDLSAAAEVDLAAGELLSLTAESGQTSADRLYREYLQPLLVGTLLEQAQWQGGFRFSYRQNPKQGAWLDVELDQLGLADMPEDDAAARFKLSGLSGQLAWSDQSARATRLSWQRGQLLGALDIGAATLAAELHGHRFSLKEPLQLPIMDGLLLVDRLDIQANPDTGPALDFDAILTPVSMRRLSTAFGWPPLSGAVSGVIPGLSLRDGELNVDGNLLVKIFDGDLVLRNLRLSSLFGLLPSLETDIAIRRLDLETLTGTFSFGKITGKLDGRIDGLRLENWRPVAFDARFATPEDDDSRHAISQRAVDNISNLGGAGIGGSLSRTFLGMFEEFRYERLGVSCLLRDGICRMGGVQPAEQGYYLVVGSGIPQINIVGFNTRTDWERLVSQLQQISAGGSPVVELNSGESSP